MRLARLIPILVLAILLPMLAGCTRTARTASPAPGNTSGEARQVSVELGEWFVRIDPNPVDAGTIRFNIRNVGERLHAFEIENGDIEEVSRNLRPGESATMTVELPAGEYHTYCPIGNHEDRGMETMLIVR